MRTNEMRFHGVISLITVGYLLNLQASRCQANASVDRPPDSEMSTSLLPLPTAIRFPVIFETSIDTLRVANGEILKCRLKEDLSIGEQIVATAGSSIIGHVSVAFIQASAPKTFSRFEVRLPKRRTVRLVFDEIETVSGESIKIVGIASPQKKEFVTNGAKREVTVKEGGELEKTYRFAGSRRMILQATDCLRERDAKMIARTFPADVEVGDELFIQAHSPYDKPEN